MKTENERNTEQHIEDDQIIEMISVDEPINPTHTKNQIIKKFKKTLEGKETNNEETIHVTSEITQKSESIKDKNKPKTTIRFSDESDKVVEVIKNIDTNACTTYPNINKEKVRLHIQYDDTDKMMTDLTNKLTKKKKASTFSTFSTFGTISTFTTINNVKLFQSFSFRKMSILDIQENRIESDRQAMRQTHPYMEMRGYI